MGDQLPTSSSSDSIVSMLDKASSGISNEDIKQALSPTMQRQPIQMPAYFSHPPKPLLPGAEMDRREVIGAGNARAQGIGNTIKAGTRALSNFIIERQNQKQMAEATRVQQLLSAQAGVDQAQELLKADPNNAAAKESLQHNQTIVQGLFQDPKFVKTVQKGFQVSLTDPSQNKTEHHSIVQKGIDLFKKQSQQPFTQQQAQQMSQKFAASQPTQIGPNQFALQQLQTRAALQKSQNEFLGKVYPAIIRAQGAKDLALFSRNASYRLEQYKQGNENSRKFAEILGNFERDRQKNMDARNLAILKADLITKRLDHLIGQAAIQPGKLIPERNTYDHQMSTLEVEQQKLVETLILDRDAGRKDKDTANKMIKAAQDDLKKIKDTHTVGLGQFNDLISGKVTFGGKPIDSSNQSGSRNDGGAASTGSGSSGGSADGILNAGSLNEIYQQLIEKDDSGPDDKQD